MKYLAPLLLIAFFVTRPATADTPWDYDRTVLLTVDEWRYAARDAVETAPPALNESEIALVATPWSVERTRPFAWFFSRVTLPEEWTGQDIHLHLEGMGPMAVFVDDILVGQGEAKGAHAMNLLLPSTLQGGDTVRLKIGVAQAGGPSELNRVWLQGEPRGLTAAQDEANGIFGSLTDYGETINPWKRMVEGPDDTAFKVDFDDSGWEDVNVGDGWRGDDVVAWYRGRLRVPNSIKGIDTSEHGVLLALDFDDPAECYINGETVSEVEKDYRGSIFAMPEGIEPGDDFLVAFRIRNRWGSGKLAKASWRLPVVDEGLALKRELQVLVNRLATTMRSHDMPEDSWVAELSAMMTPLKGATSDLPTFSDKVFAAEEAYYALEEMVQADPVLLVPPYQQDVRPTEITICFETSAAVRGQVEGKAVNKEAEPVIFSAVEMEPFDTIHKITLPGLEPDTEYAYRVRVGRQVTGWKIFKTAPAGTSPFNFLVFGDNQSGFKMFDRVSRQMAATDADFVMSVGDVVDRGINWDEWTYQYLLPGRHYMGDKPSFIAMGNHEYSGYEGNPNVLAFDYYFKHPETSPGSNQYYYSFDYGNAHFVILEPLKMKWEAHPNPELGNTVPADDPELVWLEQDLMANHGKHDWTFVFYHEPAFAQTWSGGYYDGEDFIRNAVVPILEKYDVDMVFNGHTHAYERGLPHPDTEAGNGITYIITGGGGGGLDNHKYKEWGTMDIPDHPAVADSDAPDEGTLYRHHYCDVRVDGKTLTFAAREVLPNGRLGDVMDSFKLKKD